METSIAIVAFGLLVFLAHFFSALFEKTRVPDVLPMVLLGLLAGPLAGVVGPESFGKVGGVFVVIALVIILFEGGLGLNFALLRQSLGRGTLLTVASYLATVAVTAPFATAFLGMSLLEGLMLGSIIGGTSSALVIPMAGKLKIQERTRAMLTLEASFSDVLCIVGTLALLKAVELGGLQYGPVLRQIAVSFSFAAVIGAVGALFWSVILDKVRKVENSMFTTPAFVCVIYGSAELLGLSGAIAALAFGIVLGNVGALNHPALEAAFSLRARNVNAAEKAFFGEIVFLLKSFFFVYIGLSIRFDGVLLPAAGLALTAVLYLLRIPVTWLSLDKETPRLDASLTAVMVPKGLAAAVLASLPLAAGIEKGAAMQDVVYSVILFSILATSVLAFLIEQGRLKRPYDQVFAGYGGGMGRTPGAPSGQTLPPPAAS